MLFSFSRHFALVARLSRFTRDMEISFRGRFLKKISAFLVKWDIRFYFPMRTKCGVRDYDVVPDRLLSLCENRDCKTGGDIDSLARLIALVQVGTSSGLMQLQQTCLYTQIIISNYPLPHRPHKPCVVLFCACNLGKNGYRNCRPTYFTPQ